MILSHCHHHCHDPKQLIAMYIVFSLIGLYSAIILVKNKFDIFKTNLLNVYLGTMFFIVQALAALSLLMLITMKAL